MPEVHLPAPVKAERVDDIDAPEAPTGAFAYYVHHDSGPDVMRGLIYVCPCGCRSLHALPFHPLSADDVQNNRHGWNWDGNRECPTLEPSILSHDGGKTGPTHWHGFLRNGFWTQA